MPSRQGQSTAPQGEEPTYRLEYEWVCCRCGWNYFLDTTPQTADICRTECINIDCQHARCKKSCKVTGRWVLQ